MKFVNYLIILPFVILISCSQPEEGLEAKLIKLKKQKSDIDNQIIAIEKELGSKDEKTESIEIMEVKKSNFKRYISLQSVVESDRNTLVSPKVMGVYTDILINEGDFVNEGQVIAKIDDSMIKRRLAQSENQLEFIKTIFDKQKSVWEKKVGSEIEYLKAKNDYESMQKSIEIIKEEMDMYSVKAPFAGVVDEINVKLGEAASPGMPLTRLVSNSDLKMKVEFADSYIANFKKGDPVKVYFPDLMLDTLNLKITSVTQSIDKKNRTLAAYINVPTNNKEIKPNMIAITTLNDLSVENIIKIPLNLIQKSGTNDFVYVAQKNNEGKYIASKRIVKTTHSYNEEIIITEGLNEGDLIIKTGAFNVREGQLLSLNK